MGEKLPILTVPGSLIVRFAGILKGGSWSAGDGEPLAGYYVLANAFENVWKYESGLLLIQCDRSDDAVNILAENAAGVVNFLCIDPINSEELYHNQTSPIAEFYSGTVLMAIAGDDTLDPRYLDDIVLLGQESGQNVSYLERMPLATGDTRRYARQKDHTRVYIKRS